jgi:predicted chitinase
MEYDFSSKESTIQAINDECIEQGLDLTTQIAYVLATVEHETAGTFKPVKEAYWKNEIWRQNNLRYYPYYGRGYVQLTWKENYQTYSDKLGVDLVSEPDKVMEPNIALFILIDGFKTGAFTGKKITKYINNIETDFYNARRCINGTDQATKIEALAETYLEKLDNEV